MKHAIKLYIHDSFMDAFSSLPKKMQKKTREFMKKFREDPTSSAINYEKISTFRDQSLRTVRIDLKYRAIVQSPASGDGYHLLWVDNHDEAMNWARNKVFEWNDNTQSFQMYDVVDEGAKTVAEEEPSVLAGIRLEDLEAIGTPTHMLEVVSRLGNVDQLNSIRDQLPVDNYEYLYYLLEGISLEEILEEIDAGKNATDTETSDNARKHVFVLTEDDDLEQILSGDFSKWKVFLHPTQRALAYRDYNGPTKVTGGAGTGKTVCAMHRAKYLVNKTEVFQQPVLFTTFTKSLTKYLTATMKEFNLPEEYLVIQNFDKLVFDLAKDSRYQVIPEHAGFLTESQEKAIWSEVLEYSTSTQDEDFLFSEYNDVILRHQVKTLDDYLNVSRIGRNVRIGRKDKIEIWKLVEAYRKRKAPDYSKYEVCVLLTDYFSNRTDKPFSHLICDEVQDFTNIELSLMRALVEEKGNDLFFVGDPFQNIYARKLNFSASGINVRGRRSKKLKVNYRTTEEIKLMAVHTLANEKFDDFDGEEETRKGYVSLLHGNDPEYHVFPTPEEEERYIVETINSWLRESRVTPADICLCAHTNAAVDEIKRSLTRHDFTYVDLSSSNTAANALRVSSFHNLKGHEFKFIIVTGVSADTVPLKHSGFHNYDEKSKAEYLKQERALYYVVFTRAIQGLLLTGVGERAGWF